jgi:uncharacterized protein YggE
MNKVGLVAVGLAGMLLLSAAPARVAQADSSTVSQSSITVSAEGSVIVTPDEALVTVGVQQTDLQASKAQDAANTVTATAIARIKRLDIPSRDIQTQNISLDPQYDDRGVVIGFIATDTLAITVEQVKQAGAVIDAGVGAGANRNVSVSFGLKNDAAARAAALRAGVALAQQKAAAVATQLGISLQGAKVQVTESTTPTPPVTYAQGALVPGKSAVATPVQAGSLTITDNVTVVYLL